MTFKNIFLKTDREPKHYRYTSIFFESFVVGKVFAIKRKTMALSLTEKTIKKWKQKSPWLLFTKTQKLVCAVCTSQKELFSLLEISMIHLFWQHKLLIIKCARS